MSKKSVVPGASTSSSKAEVTNIGPKGLWMLVDGVEHFLDYETFPWFMHGTVAEILHVERPHAEHLWWPELDVDLAVENLLHPEKYTLRGKVIPRMTKAA